MPDLVIDHNSKEMILIPACIHLTLPPLHTIPQCQKIPFLAPQKVPSSVTAVFPLRIPPVVRLRLSDVLLSWEHRLKPGVFPWVSGRSRKDHKPSFSQNTLLPVPVQIMNIQHSLSIRICLSSREGSGSMFASVFTCARPSSTKPCICVKVQCVY